MATTCETCSGSGTSISSSDACNTCNSEGVVEERRAVQVEIPPGVEDGMRLRISGEGHAPSIVEFLEPNTKQKPRTQRGDVIVQVRVLPHNAFARRGMDILYTAAIPVTTAILGGTAKIPTLDGDVEIRVPTGTNPGDKITMAGMGMPHVSGASRRKGDLKVEFKVNTPKALTVTQRILVELLADEMRDRGAKKIMGVKMDQMFGGGSGPGADGASEKKEAAETKQDGGEVGGEVEKNKHDGFLKNLFNKFTHLHDHKAKEDEGSSSGGSGSAEDEKKKASGSG